MTIALNILLAVVVFAGVVGMLAYNIVATRTPAQLKLRPEASKRSAPARQRAYGSPDSVRI